MITQSIAELSTMFSVDTKSGSVVWINPPKNRSGLLGKEAGCINPGRNKPYQEIRINKKNIKRAHIVYLFAHGHCAVPQVDHINGDSLDDRAVNLRPATGAENARNRKRYPKKTTLPMGVYYTRQRRFRAQICFNNKNISLGTYATPQEASAVYQYARKQYFGEFA